MLWSNPFPSAVKEFTTEVESEFAFNQPAVDPMQECKNECLQSFCFTADLVALDDFDDNDALVDNSGDEPDSVTNHNCRSRAGNGYAFEFGNVHKSNRYAKFLHPSV